MKKLIAISPSGQMARFAGPVAALLAVCAPSGQAASGTWLGGSSAQWTNPANWSAASVPGAGETATFNSAGNGNTALFFSGSATVGAVIFDTASVASYGIYDGIGGLSTLALGPAGTITMSASVAAPQEIATNLTLGTASGSDTFTFTNASIVSGATLFFSGTIGTGANTGLKTLAVAGAGTTEIMRGITNGAGSVAVAKSGTGTLNFAPGSVLGFNQLTASDGTVNVNAALGAGAGTAAVSVTNTLGGAPTTVKFGYVSQQLSSLTIGAGAKVVFTSSVASFADVGEGKAGSLTASSVVPEPGSIGLLLLGGLGLLQCRYRHSGNWLGK
ncbi:MAG: PEP-CTERM sorting domain-containing protein [Chthoniobacter sp.]|nr:PEP-CTERM sorting domain-containing protein [Chthoniobacter sp.]